MRAKPLAGLLGAVAFATSLHAQVPGEKAVDGIVVRIGVAEAGQVAKHAAAHGEQGMHGGPKRGENEHVVVSLVEAGTGQPIGNADVTLVVDRGGVSHVRRKLELMPLPEVPSFGGWFDLGQPGPYRITVEVARPGGSRATVARFEMNNR